MKVKMLVSITGTINGKDWPATGGVIDLTADVAADLISNRYAEPIVDTPPRETAAADPVNETAVAPTGKARRKPAGG